MSVLSTLRSVRIGPFAIFDFTAAGTGMYFLAPHIGLNPERALWLTLPLGIVVHKVLGIQTPLNQMVLGDNPSRVAQIVLVIMLFKATTCCKQLI